MKFLRNCRQDCHQCLYAGNEIEMQVISGMMPEKWQAWIIT